MKAALRYLTLFLGVATLGAQQPSFKVDVRLVRLLVTVKNAAGDLVGQLNRSDFSVQDDGVAQDIALFDHQTSQPLSVTLLLDTSASTGKDIRYETASITKFLNALVQEGNPDDTVSLYTFNWQVTLLNSFTRRISRI
jgi:Ca-activated chloride channel family protein